MTPITGKQDLSERAQRLRERQELLVSANNAIIFDSAANLEIEDQRYLMLIPSDRISCNKSVFLGIVLLNCDNSQRYYGRPSFPLCP